MSRIERELYDLEEHLRRNDDSADSSTYLTIIGIANDVSEIEAKNEKLRELLHKLGHFEKFGCHECLYEERCAKSIYDVDCSMRLEIEKEMRELGIEVAE